MSNKFFHFHRGDKIVFLLFLALFASGILLFFFSPPGKADTSDTTKEWSTRPKKQVIQPNKEERRGGHGRDTIETDEHYVGPPQPLTYTPKKTIPKGVVLDLNRADSATLTQIPGIGPAFARRIVTYRTRLGGYYTVLQLQEVYGMTQEKYDQIKTYFSIETPPMVTSWHSLSYDSIPRHPYLNYLQRSALERILYRDGNLQGWQQLLNLSEFSREDSVRLSHYFSF